jgi:hypothetical protein
VAITLIVMQTSVGQSLLRDAGLSRTTEPFIELYFPNASALPSQVSPSDHLDLDFAVDNVAPTAHRFAWQVSEKTNRVEIGLAFGRIVVPARQRAVVSQRLRVYCLSERIQILVSVARSSARITLWLSCPRRR